MMEVILPKTTLSFDGRVIEIFQSASSTGSRRFHIAHLVSAELESGRKQAVLKLRFPHAGIVEAVPAEMEPAVREFIESLTPRDV